MAPPQRPPPHSSPSSLPPLSSLPPQIPSRPSPPLSPSHPSPPLLSRSSPPRTFLSSLRPLSSLFFLCGRGWSSMTRPLRLHSCMCAMRLRTLSARSVRRTCGSLFVRRGECVRAPMAYTIAARARRMRDYAPHADVWTSAWILLCWLDELWTACAAHEWRRLRCTTARAPVATDRLGRTQTYCVLILVVSDVARWLLAA